VLLLAGRAWLVTHVDWKRRRCFVESTDLPGRAKWGGLGGGLSFEITRGMRDVLLRADLGEVQLSRRAATVLTDLRHTYAGVVAADGTVVRRSADGDLHWWTWAGAAANRTLHASLSGIVDPRQRIGDQVLRLRRGGDLRAAFATLVSGQAEPLRNPSPDVSAVRGLKFSAALPAELAVMTVAERLGNLDGASQVLSEPGKLRADA
jgi:ATP-dependent Lhr-like helicase